MVNCRLMIATGVLFVFGCGGSETGPDPRVPVSQRHVVRAGTPAGDGLSLPGEKGFNIPLKQSSQNPGAGGTARGDSDASPQGNAFCFAEVAKGGSAHAEFKIGHRIDNNDAAVVDASVQVQFDLESSLEASDVPAPATTAAGNLDLMVIDSHKRVVSKTPLIQSTSDDAPGSGSGPQRRQLKVRMEPGESYDFVLYGRVQAAASESQQAKARIGLSQLRMQFTFRSGTTQPAVK